MDFSETFSPVVKPAIVRTRHWPVYQLDVKNAFLHNTLTDTIYCMQPSCFEDPTHPDFVCHLNKSLYGLKQAPRAWYSRFATHLLSWVSGSQVGHFAICLLARIRHNLFVALCR